MKYYREGSSDATALGSILCRGVFAASFPFVSDAALQNLRHEVSLPHGQPHFGVAREGNVREAQPVASIPV